MKQTTLIHKYFSDLQHEMGSVESYCINNFLPESFCFLLDAHKGKIICIIDDNLFPSISEAIGLNWELNRVLLVPPTPGQTSTSPKGFISSYQKQIDLFKIVSSTLWNEIGGIVVSQSQVDIAISNNSTNSSFSISENTEFESLLLFIKENDYVQTDLVLEPGQYCVRGGLVDIFSPATKGPIRVSFIDADISIFSFDIDSQITTGRQQACLLPSLSNNKQMAGELLSSKIADQWLKCYINTVSTISFKENCSHTSVTFPFKSFDHTEYTSLCRHNYETTTISNHLSVGFISRDNHMIIPEWFAKRKDAVGGLVQKQGSVQFLQDELEVGDFVIHRDCGIGRYAGLKIVEYNDGSKQELVVLEYSGGGRISVDVEHMNKLSYYASKTDGEIDTDSLSKRGPWNKRKKSAKKRAEEIVQSLLSSYAIRGEACREPIQNDPELEALFISHFPYDDTPDQERAWREISSDLSNNIPMDRLICGDVGFGKTELAIRAAFRLVSANKRVAVIAPTTILTQQLFDAFRGRLNSFGIVVDFVSRFKSRAEIEKSKLRWVENKTDVLIGTHILINDSIYLNNSDLLIVDEEHRFGVKQKEKIKSVRHSIDILSMSATPIPRTLHLALSGIRKISTLTTPPKSRLPIETQISYYNEPLIARAISNEISRSGQVYFVHNDVQTLPALYSMIASMCPNINVDILHGQLPSSETERIMTLFHDGKIDVLVCTSIIETGIDVTNANTVIINNAHRFGLSQLYQIRGRVGRGGVKAFASLLIPVKINLSRSAFLRLKTIENNTHLGAGYNISNMDLKIRGAGSLFGYNQSGGAGGVGFELYAVLIKEAVSVFSAASENKISLDEIEVKVLTNLYIPLEYIGPGYLRLSFYRKLSSTESIEDVDAVQYELQNRFGLIPPSVGRIVDSRKFKILASSAGVLKIEKTNGFLSFYFEKKSVEHCIEKLFSGVDSHLKKYNMKHVIKLNRKGVLVLVITLSGGLFSSTVVFRILNKLSAIINK